MIRATCSHSIASYIAGTNICGECLPPGFVVPSTDEGETLMNVICNVLSVREGETLTPELINERARNAAAAIMCAYEMRAR